MTLAVTVKVLSQCHQPLFTGSDVLSHFSVVCVFFFLFFPDDLEMEGALQKGKLRLLLKNCLLLRKRGKRFWFRLTGVDYDRGDLSL